MKKMFTLLFLLFSINLFSQSSWINYANDHIIFDMALENDQLWVGSQGGLIKIDTETGDKETFQAWNSGLRGTGIREVEIADDGTKWLGGENGGLFKFDGINWEQFYYINTGDTLIQIVNLKLDPNGNPWFFSNVNGNCTGCKKFISYDGNEFQNHDDIFLDYSNTGNFADFDFINPGELWVAYANNILKYNGNEIIEAYDESNTPLSQDESINQIEIDNQGNLWLTTSRHSSGNYFYRILKFDGTNWSVENDAVPGTAYKFFQDDNGNFWFDFYNSNTNERSYGSFDGTNWSFWSLSEIPALPTLGNEPIFHMVDPQGNWWMVSYSGIHEPKVYKIEGTSFTPYNTEIFPLGTNYYDDIFADCDNNIWAVGRGSLSKFNGQNWENINGNQSGFAGSPWEAAIDPTNCDIWFALYSSGSADTDVGRYDGSEFEIFSVGDGSSIGVDISDDGIVYVATTQQGLGRYMNGNWFYFHEANSPLTNFVRAIKIQSNGTIWASTYGEGLARRAGTEWTVFDSSNSPVEDYSSRIHLDNNENIWVRSGAGLAKYDGTDWEIFSFGLEPSGVNCITEDHLGNYWLGTQRGALYWNGFDYIVFDVSNSNIGSNSIRKIHIDPINGNIWFLHSTGVSVLKGFHVEESISGVAFFDANLDGVFDINEDVRLPDQQIFLLPDSTSAITNSIGAYSFYPEDIGDYQITYEPSVPYMPTSPSILDTFFNEESIVDINFGTWTEDIPSGVSIDIVAGPSVCNSQVNIWVTFRNEGFLNISGEINLSFHSDFNYSSSYPEVSNIGNYQVTWTFSDLSFMHSRTYKLVLSVPGVDALNQEYDFTAEIITSNSNQSVTVSEEVLCSYDPNDKTATPLGESISNYSLLDDPIQYTIRFQNMGNYLAKDILISDIIDPLLDISTFKIISSSHEMTTTIESDRQVVFRFNDINLPPEEQDYLGSQGYVKYQIAPLQGLSDSTIILNTAAIYFDLNPAIETNTTENILVESLPVSTIDLESTPQALIYPNPSSGEIWVEWQDTNNNSNWQVEVYDLSGKLLFHQKASTAKVQLSIPEKGFYFIKIRKGEYLQVEKVVILGF